jgi:DNA repair protein RecO (recombination protein O)
VTTYRDSAVVLRKLDYGEADRIFTLLTRDHGKVGAIAKGVRRVNSKLAAALELYAQVDVLLAHGRNLDVVAEAHRTADTPRMDADLERTSRAALVAELAERICEDRHPLDGLFELTAGALDGVALDPEPRRAAAWFLARALDLMGYAPQLSNCVRCDRPLTPDPAPFDAASGGFLCSSCSDPATPLVGVTAIKVLRVMFARDGALFSRLKLEAGIMDEVEDVLTDQLEYHLDRRLNSLRFLRRLRT